MRSARNSFAGFILRPAFLLVMLTILTVSAFASPAIPVPIITFLSPVSTNPGGADLALTVNGANFVNGVSVVNWKGNALATTFVNSTKLTATVPAAQTASAGTGWITVVNPSCGGECTLTSNVVFFPVVGSTATYTAAELTAAVGSGPLQLTRGDFNGDGNLDLAVSNFEGTTVSILLGNGDGTFQTQTTLSTISSPFGIAVGDLNGDGIPDLVVGNDSPNGGLNIFLGDGSGGFTSGVTLGGGRCLLEPVLADVNRDGKLDIVVGNDCTTGIELYLGNGDGTFAAPMLVSGSSSLFGLLVADFNGDGVLDIAAANYGTNVLDIYLGVGDGTFGSVSHIAIPGVVQLAAADMDGDGKVDLIAASESSGIYLLYGNGDGTFKPAVLVASGGYYALATGDLNGDGNLDIVAVSSSDLVQAWFSSGDGTFQPAKTLGSAFSYGIALGNFATGGGLDIAVADLSANRADIFLPTVVISPSSKNFGSVAVGSPTAQTFTVTNDSSATVAISTVSFTGANPGDFAQINTCSSPLAPAGTCAVTVTFTPAAAGARAATLTVTDDGPASPQTASLTGTGTAAPVATLSATTLAFGNQTLHVTSAAQPVTLTNTGSASLTGITISVSGTSDFAQTNNCPATLTVSSLCTVSLTFTPGAVGLESASLQFSDNAGNSPQAVALSGTGLDVPAKLNYVQAPPASLLAGSAIGTISVGVYDATSQLVTTSSANVTVAITGPNAFLQSQTAAASSGIATFDFSGVPLDAAGQYTETASSSGVSSALSTTAVTPLLTSELMVVAGYPSPTYASLPHPFTVSVTDSFGNAVTSYTGTVTLISSDANAVVAPTPYTFVGADMGTHTFSATFLTVGTQTITVTDGVLSGSQPGIVVNPRPQLVVNLLADDAGSGSACDGSVPCSLRSALNQANTLGAGDITVDTSQFGGSAPWTSTLTNGVLGLSSNLSITGPGQAQLILSGNNLSSIFQVSTGAIVAIGGLSVTAGSSAGNGGGITNAGTLTLSNVAVSNSMATQDGGGIYSSGSLTANSTTISGNTSTGNGGGVATTGTFVLYDSTLSGNSATGNGGGIDNSGALSIPQSTLYGNSALDGAGIENEASGTTVLAQSTVSGNIASGETGGTITNQNSAASAVTILNSIVAGNTAPGGDCVGCGSQISFNLFDVAAATLKLGALANNGGPTETLLPLAGSPAMGSGSVGLTTDSGLPQSLVNDQRGTGYSRIVNNSVDLGSVQDNSGPPSSIVLTVTGSSMAGNALSATLQALTAGENPDAAYSGTIHFTSSDAHAVLPADYTFVPADSGTHIFSVTLESSGAQTLIAVDTGNAALQATQTIAVSAAAAATVSVNGGSGQTAIEGSAFATALSAKVSDAFGNTVPGTTVVFTAPASSSGASGTFAGGSSSVSVATDTNGVATSPAFTANSTAGQYSVSAAVQELTSVTFALTNVIPPDYSITANPTSLTIVQGQSGSTVLTLTPVGGMTGTVAFTCTGLPAKSSCAFAPTQVVMSGNDAVQTVTLTVNTTGPNGAVSQVRLGFPPTATAPTTTASPAWFVLPAGFLMLAIPAWITTGRKHRRYITASLLTLLATFTAIGLIAGLTAGLTACSGVSSPGGGGGGGTPPGQYSVTAAASISGSNSHSALVSITITK